MSLIIQKNRPTIDDIDKVLGDYNTLCKILLNDKELPKEGTWIEHLSILSAVRIDANDNSTIRYFEDIILDQFESYFQIGLSYESDFFTSTRNFFLRKGIPLNILTPHPLKRGEMIILVPKNCKLNEDQIISIQEVISKMKGSNDNDKEMNTVFWAKWDSYEYLKKVHQWWNNFPISFSITHIGNALANAYIHGKDKTIPYLS